LEQKERGKRSAAAQAKVDAEAEKLSDMAVPALKALLKANNQSQSGTKAELLDRAAYCAAFGALCVPLIAFFRARVCLIMIGHGVPSAAAGS
jgi:hypothetical protein